MVFFILLGTGCSTLEKTYHKTRNALVNFVSVAKETSLPIFEQGEYIDLQFARHQFNRREYAVSEFYTKKTLANYPDNKEAIQLLPWTYFFQKRFDKALTAFKQAHTLYKKDPTPLLGMGWCYFSLKHYQKLWKVLNMQKDLPHIPMKFIKGWLSYIWHKGGANLPKKSWEKFLVLPR